MGFNSVYRVLQEVFPQVDSRMLRAVAIEHSKDADVAVEVVLHEVIPCLYEQSLKVGISSKNKSSLHISEDASSSGKLEGTTIVGPVAMVSSIQSSFHDANGEFGPFCDGVPMNSSKIDPDSASPAMIIENGSYVNHDQEFVTNEGQDVESLSKSFGPVQEEARLHADCEPLHQSPEPIDPTSSHFVGNLDNVSSTSVCENGSYDNHDQEFVTNKSQDTSLGNSSVSVQEEATFHVNYEPFNQLTEPIGPSSSQLVANPDMQLAVNEEFGLSSSSSDALATEMVCVEDESTMNSVITRSNQICSTEFLEDIIEDARNNKKILVSAMESVVNLMREVECKEKVVEQVKEEAGRGCSDILAKVDEVQQALLRAKEANDMHAGEVYAEKAILATEVKELQLRLLNLSDERDKSLGILDEMRKALEIRLAASLKEIEMAEKEKLDKQRSAREELLYQESQMEKVVEESKRLKLEAEENSKLQEFLMDRGRAIDVLQGEISVKCQDVRLLKEKFDKRIPLGRSLSSSQASSVLASSGSSLRSFTTPHEPGSDTFETQKKSADLDDSYGFPEESFRSKQAHLPDPSDETVYSVDDHFPNGEEKRREDRKVLLDDGWELFDV